jgi:hypothetical protein
MGRKNNLFGKKITVEKSYLMDIRHLLNFNE